MTETLDQIPLLAELISDDRRALSEFLTSRELDAGSTLFRASEEAEELYFVVEGSLAIRSEGQTIAELGPGEVLGALSLVSVGRRECEAVAVEPTRLWSLSRESFLRLRGDLPGVALQLEEAILRTFSSLVRNILGDARAPSSPIS
jgi:CRP-like cAMP-binding protein